MVCCFFEVALITFGRKVFGIYGTPLAIFGSSLLVGLYALWISHAYRLPLKQGHSSTTPWKQVSIQLGVFLAGLLAFGYWVYTYQVPVFRDYPINPAFSDVIPQIEVLAKRWLDGELPYRTIEWEYKLFCPYMPFHWMPYSLGIVWEIDLRWIPLICFALFYVIYLVWLAFHKNPLIRGILLGTLPGLFLVAILLYYPAVVAFTAELLLAGYYLIVGLCIISRSPYLRAVGLILGLLSRYSVLFWVPLYVLLLFLYEDKRKALITSGVALLGILLIYVIPFLLKDWTIFQQGLAYHSRVLEGMWHPANWQDDYRPYVMIQGFGFAAYFYELPFDPKTRLQIMQVSQILLSVLLLTAWGFLCRKFKHTVPLPLYLLFGLKVYLALLYSMMPNPFGYYFFLPVGISLVIVAWVWKADPVPLSSKLSAET